MKLILSAFAAAALLACSASAQPPSQPPTGPRVPPALAPRMPPGRPPNAPPPAMPDKDKLSYAIGMSVATSIKRDQLDLDIDTLAGAMKDVLGDKPTRFTEAELKEIMTQFNQAMPGWVAVQNKTKGDAYLAKNAKAPGVTVLPNGIQYKVIKVGAGEMPQTNSTVVVKYKGTMIDGVVFDQNANFKTPVTGRTIKGWSEILPLMKTGSEWEVTIPSDLAYGARGPRTIGPNAVLIFDMELISVGPPEAEPARPAPPIKPPPKPVSGIPMRMNQPNNSQPNNPPPMPGTTTVSGQIIKVPSAEDLKKGAKIEVITNPPSSSQQ